MTKKLTKWTKAKKWVKNNVAVVLEENNIQYGYYFMFEFAWRAGYEAGLRKRSDQLKGALDYANEDNQKLLLNAPMREWYAIFNKRASVWKAKAEERERVLAGLKQDLKKLFRTKMIHRKEDTDKWMLSVHDGTLDAKDVFRWFIRCGDIRELLDKWFKEEG